MKILITGGAGLVGSRFVETKRNKFDLLCPTQQDLDITNKEQITEYLKIHQPNAIINFAAFTDVKKAELERGDKTGLAWKINVEGVKNLYDSAQNLNIHLIHISTDLIFSGKSSPEEKYTEEDSLEDQDEDQISWYGITKLEAEKYLRNHHSGNCSVVRIAYPFREEYAAKLDFARTFLSLYDGDKLYPLFPDNVIHTTYIDELCEALDKIVTSRIYGVFHVVSPQPTTHYDFAKYLLEQSGRDATKLTTIPMSEFKIKFPSPPRPLYTPMDTLHTQKVLGMKLRSWKENVDTFVAKTTKK